MRTSVVVLCVILLSGTTFGDEKKPIPGEKNMPVEPDKAGIEYLRDINDNVIIALRPQMPMDVDVQVQGDEVRVVGWVRVREKRKENTCFTITLKNPRSVTITGVRMKATDAQKECFTDPFGFRYILLSGPSLREKSPQEQQLVGTIEWREESGALVTFTEPSVGKLTVIRKWMRWPRRCCPKQDDPKKNNPPLPVLPPEYVKVEAFGTLKVGILAIGGETTDYAVTAKGQTWELDFHKDNNLIQRAKELDGQKVWVRGDIDFRRYVERKIVNTILVDDLRDASYVPPKKKS